MDIEQLKLILEAAKAAGDGAVHVVFIWFAYKFIMGFFHYGVFGALFYTAFKIVNKCVNTFSFKARIEGVLGYWLSDNYYDSFCEWLRDRHKDSPYKKH
jgi:hypothetical protein